MRVSDPIDINWKTVAGLDPGVHGLRRLAVGNDGWIDPGPRVLPEAMYPFLAKVETMAREHRFSHGTCYMRVLPAEGCGTGAVHRDTGEAHRFVMASAEDGTPVQTCFPHYTQEENGKLIHFTTEPHFRHSAPAGSGVRAFFSAALYFPWQELDLSCPVLAPLR